MGLPLRAPSSPTLAALHAALPADLRHTLRRADQLHAERRHHLATGRSELDRLLGGGFPYGALTEIRGHVGSGRFATVLASLAAATSGGEYAALVDLGDGLDPKLARTTGVDLERVLWIRPRHLREAAAAAEIAITGGFSLVAVDLGLPPVARGGRVDAGIWIRLARTAAREHCALLVATTWPLDSPAAELVLTYSRRRGTWFGHGMPLLGGVEGEIHIERGRTRNTAPARLVWRLPGAWAEEGTRDQGPGTEEGTRYQVPGTPPPLRSDSFPIPGPGSPVPGPSSPFPDTQYPIPNTSSPPLPSPRSPVPGTSSPIPP